MDVIDIDLRQVIEDLTGQRFSRENKIYSPFKTEKTPSFAIYFDSNSNKQKFKDFSTGKTGDAIDIVRELKGLDYKGAREYLGLTVEKSVQEQQAEKIKSYIKWQIEKCDFRKGQKLLGLFEFVN
ncbi:MAG: primase, partial [Anaerocolumna sp.]|nr:primase [Anaerocolumna sp.]